MADVAFVTEETMSLEAETDEVAVGGGGPDAAAEAPYEGTTAVFPALRGAWLVTRWAPASTGR